MKRIYGNAFLSCSNLTDVYCYADNVPYTAGDVFGYTNIASGTLHVPEGSIDLYRTTSPWSGFGNIVALTEPVTYTENQMATIILPTTPDASKGKYYRLDRCENEEIIFEQELQPQARTPYIIVPGEDFNIDPSSLDLEGLTHDEVSIEGILFIGSYHREELLALTEGDGASYIEIIDATPDCQDNQLTSGRFTIGALRAYLTINWDDPYSHGGTKSPSERMEIVLNDYGTGIDTIQNGEMVNGKWSNGKCFDLSGRKLFGKPSRGIYIKEGKKVVMK